MAPKKKDQYFIASETTSVPGSQLRGPAVRLVTASACAARASPSVPITPVLGAEYRPGDPAATGGVCIAGWAPSTRGPRSLRRSHVGGCLLYSVCDFEQAHPSLGLGDHIDGFQPWEVKLLQYTRDRELKLYCGADSR